MLRRFSGDVGGVPQRKELRGLAGPRLKLTVGLLGAPALTLDELKVAPKRTALTANLTVAPPWGDYDPDQLVNLGNDRWAFKPEVGVYQPVGRFTLAGYAGAWFFTANHEYSTGSAVKRLDPWWRCAATLLTLRPAVSGGRSCECHWLDGFLEGFPPLEGKPREPARVAVQTALPRVPPGLNVASVHPTVKC